MAAARLTCSTTWSQIARNLRSNHAVSAQRSLHKYNRGAVVAINDSRLSHVNQMSTDATQSQGQPDKQAQPSPKKPSFSADFVKKPSYKKDDDFWRNRIEQYESGKRWLACMMGEDPATFTDADIEEALKYLLPSSLFAKDARPMIKHPSLLFPHRKEDLFDKDGRPVQLGFYSGQVPLNDLLYDIFKQVDILMKDQEVKSQARVKQLGMSDQLLKDVVAQKQRDASNIKWISREKLQKMIGGPISEREYRMVILRLTELAQFENAHLITNFLKKFMKDKDGDDLGFTPDELDELGRAHAFGYRKSSVAEVWVKPGTGVVTINDQPFIEYFDRIQERHQIAYPFLVIGELGKYDVECNVIGGGVTGQSGAIRLAISRALLSFSEEFRPKLEEAHLLEVDSRKVERKKPGQLKARKKFAWVAR